jgi:L-ectoine synthase
MKVLDVKDLLGTEREVKCPKGNFTSFRMLLDRDGMGFTLCKTVIPVGGPYFWHYAAHLEACFCIVGRGSVKNLTTGEEFAVHPGVCYVLDNHDPHEFTAFELTELISVFNPPLEGKETHDDNGSY